MSEPDHSAAALQRYRAGLRRPRRIYGSVVAAIVIVLGVVFVVAWTRGETNNTTSRTVAGPPADLAVGTPSADPAVAWRTTATAAIGDPQWRGTVVVSDRHAVRGVDARTGRTTWSYRRSDRTVCTAGQSGGVTVAVYRLRGNCDEVTGLDSATGQRRWTRTLDMDGMPVSGTPSFSLASSYGSGTFLVRTASVVYALDSEGGGNRWTYTRYGCRITGATVGSAGGLISQTCDSRLTCGKLKFCFTGPQLFLLPNGFNRDDAAYKDTNPDHITWNRRESAVPVTAGALVSAYADGALLQVDVKSGRTVVTTPLPAARPRAAAETKDIQFITSGDTTYAVRSSIAEPLWTRAGAVTVGSAEVGQEPEAATARVTLATATGATVVTGSSGAVTGTYALPDLPASAHLYRLGRGFLATGSRGTVAYS